MPAAMGSLVTPIQEGAVQNNGRAQPWKDFMAQAAGASSRESDFITIRSVYDQSGKEVHDYTAQLG
ncbi:uncharacterized protein BBA_00932 [Beauveria bassiana ARSEF 2860]|uniref:Uncharacterized protein n=1 Tax=Beauveria bassiana (strain ARSEF 2860) TaxID=655819 RepID=J5K0K7_BEAB2|nr:uncharacterized protein BBA_00932 [Beauveria bassiana ARSEF 2860]EJP70063.1 hypothetical protein BBA_00932 [Beauveria bassiana ARSEF 2860]